MSIKKKEIVVSILFESFKSNKSVNYVVKQGSNKEKRIRRLMEYCYDSCQQFGEIYLTTDQNSCALIHFPHKKKITLRGTFNDIKLILYSIGVFGVVKAMKREAAIKKNHPKSPFYYLWYIGVLPSQQGAGLGTNLLKIILENAKKNNLPIYLETSEEKNFSWYEKEGFSLYNTLNLPYTLKFYKYI
jgi:hypothetical protein